ncbi:MAG: helix-turn-helix transcriptional regulator [Luteolibacter sp.]
MAEKLVSKIIEARKAKGLSINKLAWMSGVSPKAITFIEQGVHSPTLKTFFRLAVALELDLSDVFDQAMEFRPDAEELKSRGGKSDGKS